MNAIYNILLAVFIISLISLIGVFTISLAQKELKKILLFLVSFSAGALLGDAFLHLIPEIAETQGLNTATTISLIGGILLFFILEKFLNWQHCHEPVCVGHNHSLAFINLVGDAFHNFLDGVLIAGSFMISPGLGITTTIAIALHEIPQEIGDFSILLYSGLSRAKALFFNFISALFAFAGAISFIILADSISLIETLILPITAGGFIYIALADLIPELHKETHLGKSIIQLISLILGISIMALLLFL
ncbi:MAG: ZIP family metal transporter [Candidatus Liptonbacteria bacterium CG11_big_fil_rev_8_21_14_0_20_35_14]|uniref:ZIP family metal transporter n=1 Tax=Candidatus Liptonbacteria bacterium CG11_big_fil_rev_8_21_14_0_20_35_14 TaxID=1974634 RepID=A0A2H0N7P1_9BACT|nr:MAG: ZIP family metal transporter [Candidatus Liptonbacteria bacterium CG11_big_fil_rev_8_21_14_0_20_35_14]